MNVVKRVVEVLVERIVPVVGAMFAAQLEKVSALLQAEQQDEIEEHAKHFEHEGKPHIAAALRATASQINPDDPASHGCRVVHNLCQPDAQNNVAPCLEYEEPTSTDDDSPRKPCKTPRRRSRRSRAES